MTTTKDIKWNSEAYDQQHDFVFRFGENLIELLAPQPREYILDIGCGTGHLTAQIAATGAEVTGIDSSVPMIQQAKSLYPEVNFLVRSVNDFISDKSYDALFSNATLHWVKDQKSAIDNMYRNLKQNGRLVLEMGAKDNVITIVSALKSVLGKKGLSQNSQYNQWYFPSLAEYSELLENRGFKVTYATQFARDTILKDAVHGIQEWLKMFAAGYMEGLSEEQANDILQEVEDLLRPHLFINGQWHADYQRLRIVAIKEGRKNKSIFFN